MVVLVVQCCRYSGSRFDGSGVVVVVLVVVLVGLKW